MLEALPQGKCRSVAILGRKSEPHQANQQLLVFWCSKDIIYPYCITLKSMALPSGTRILSSSRKENWSNMATATEPKTIIPNGKVSGVRERRNRQATKDIVNTTITPAMVLSPRMGR